MKQFKVFICLISTVFFISSIANADLLDGESLLNSIKNNDHENIQSIDKFYDGYIRGVADATIDVVWCPPNNSKGRQLHRIIKNHYKDIPINPNEESHPAKFLILDALTAAYPCKI